MKLKRLRFSHRPLLFTFFAVSLAAGAYLLLWAPLASAQFERLSNPAALSLESPLSSVAATNEQIISIPALGITEIIHEGSTEKTLDRGVWRAPYTSTPAQRGNTVLAGHRTLNYVRPGIFFHFDKLTLNDDIVVQWHGRQFHYRVTKIFVVPSSAIEITKPTPDPRLTLYTCTPIWTSAQRLVVQAELVE